MAQQTLNELYEIIKNRKAQPKEGSYTNYLFDKGLDKILKKVGEEATEVVIAAKNEDPQELIYETADVAFFKDVLRCYSVLLQAFAWKNSFNVSS